MSGPPLPQYIQNLVRLNIAATAELKALHGHVYAADQFFTASDRGLCISAKGLWMPYICCFTISSAPTLSAVLNRRPGPPGPYNGCASLWPLLAKSLRLYPKLVRAEQLVARAAVDDGDTLWFLGVYPANKLEIIGAYQAALTECRLLPKTAALISYLLDVARPTIVAEEPVTTDNYVSFTVRDSLGNPVESCLVDAVSSDPSVISVDDTPRSVDAIGVVTFDLTASGMSGQSATITASVTGSASTASTTVTIP